MDVKDYFTGRLRYDLDKFYFEGEGGSIVIDEAFKGELIFRYEGYHEETVGYNRNYNIYYGTNNTITVRTKHEDETFYIFLENQRNKEQFFELLDFTHRKKMNFKEFTRGERTYLGKKLTFKEIQDFKNNA